MNDTLKDAVQDAVTDEKMLLQRAQALDNAALGEIHDRYYPEIYRYAYNRVGEQASAEDIASEVFLRLLNALHSQHAPQTTLRGWLFGVAAHLVVDLFRRRKTVALDESVPDGKAARLAEDALHQSDLRAALHGLTGEQKEVLALRFGEGFSIEETADLMKRSVTAVKALQFRAVESLRRELVKDEENG